MVARDFTGLSGRIDEASLMAEPGGIIRVFLEGLNIIFAAFNLEMVECDISFDGLSVPIIRIDFTGLEGTIVFFPPPKTLIASAIFDLIGEAGRFVGIGGLVGLLGLSNSFAGEVGLVGETGLCDDAEGAGNRLNVGCGFEGTIDVSCHDHTLIYFNELTRL